MSNAKPDTSEAAVERAAQGLEFVEARLDLSSAETQRICVQNLAAGAATLRALLAERDAAKADVERLGRELNTSRYGPKHFGEDFHEKFGADILAERNAAVIARDDAIRRLADAARDAGRWRGISEGNDIVIKHLRAERDALRAERDSLRDALEKALEWIEGWDPGFTMEPDWPADHAAHSGVLAALREAGHE